MVELRVAVIGVPNNSEPQEPISWLEHLDYRTSQRRTYVRMALAIAGISILILASDGADASVRTGVSGLPE